MGKYVNEHLIANETVIYEAKHHWLQYLRPITSIVFGIFIFFGPYRNAVLSDPGLEHATPFLLAFSSFSFMFYGIFAAIYAFLRSKTTELAVTNIRVIVKYGIIRQDSVELNLSQLEGLGVLRGLLDRIFGAGTLVFTGSGGKPVRLKNIDDPQAFRKKAVEQSTQTKDGNRAP